MCAVTSSTDQRDTSLAARLAVAMARIAGSDEMPALLIDLSPTGSATDGRSAGSPATLDGRLSGIAELIDSVRPASQAHGSAFDVVVPSHQALLDDAAARRLLDTVAASYGYVIIAAPPVDDGSPAAAFLSLAHGVVLVAQLDRSGRRSVDRAIGVLEQLRSDGIYVLVLGRHDRIDTKAAAQGVPVPARV